MAPRNVIVWILYLGIVVLLMTTCVQAQERVEVPASKILEQIENGEDVYFENVRITGELNLSNIELETVPIARQRGLTLKTDPESEIIVVQKPWHGGRPIKLLGLEEVLKVVESEITIKDSIFENEVDFSNTLFIKPLYFYGTSFSGKTDFSRASFSGVVFGDAIFSSESNFRYARFNGYTDFVYARFNDNTNFAYARFNDNTNFVYTIFSGNAFFDLAEFDKVFFSDVEFSRVSFSGFDFKFMEVSWSSLENALVFHGPTYIKLIKNFREMEQFEDADDAYYQYRRLSQANKKLSFSKLRDVVAWVTCGYGVEPGYAVAWAVAIILIFTPIYGWRGGIRRLKENDEVAEQDVSFWKALGNAFYFSVVTFTTIGSGDLDPADRYRKAAVVIEGLFGWLILALFIVTLANVMIRP